MLNYKEADNSIYGYEDVPFWLNNETMIDSYFCDPPHKHMIKGDLWITKNNKLRELLKKGPNSSEPQKINFSKALIQITTALDTYITEMTL